MPEFSAHNKYTCTRSVPGLTCSMYNGSVLVPGVGDQVQVYLVTDRCNSTEAACRNKMACHCHVVPSARQVHQSGAGSGSKASLLKLTASMKSKWIQ